MTMKKWFLSQDGELSGPLTEVEAIAFIQDKPGCYGWKTGYTQWLPVSFIAEFAAHAGAVESPAKIPQSLIDEFNTKRDKLNTNLAAMDESIKFTKTYLYELEQEINIYKRLTHKLSDEMKQGIGGIEESYASYQKVLEDLVYAVSMAKVEMAEVTAEFDKRAKQRASDEASVPVPPQAVSLVLEDGPAADKVSAAVAEKAKAELSLKETPKETAKDPVASAAKDAAAALRESVAPKAEPEMTLEPEVAPEPEAIVEPEISPEPEIALEPEASFETDTEINLESELTLEPEIVLDPEIELEAEPELVAKAAPSVPASPEPLEFEPKADAKVVALDPVASKSVSFDAQSDKNGALDPVASKTLNFDPVASEPLAVDPIANKVVALDPVATPLAPVDPVPSKSISMDPVASKADPLQFFAEISARTASMDPVASRPPAGMDKMLFGFNAEEFDPQAVPTAPKLDATPVPDVVAKGATGSAPEAQAAPQKPEIKAVQSVPEAKADTSKADPKKESAQSEEAKKADPAAKLQTVTSIFKSVFKGDKKDEISFLGEAEAGPAAKAEEIDEEVEEALTAELDEAEGGDKPKDTFASSAHNEDIKGRMRRRSRRRS